MPAYEALASNDKTWLLHNAPFQKRQTLQHGAVLEEDRSQRPAKIYAPQLTSIHSGTSQQT